MTIKVNGITLSDDFKYGKLGSVKVEFNHFESLALKAFINHSDDIISVNSLMDAVWMQTVVTDSSVRKLLGGLRKKLGQEAIDNIRGVGYRLNFESVLDDDTPSSDFMTTPNQLNSSLKKYIAFIASTFFILIFTIFCIQTDGLNLGASERALVASKSERLFSSQSFLWDYTVFNEHLYLVDRNVSGSKIVEVKNGVGVDVFVPSIKSASINSLSISPQGLYSTVSISTGTQCKLLVFSGVFGDLYSSVDCVHKNKHLVVDWIDDSSFVFNYMTTANVSARPYLYRIDSKEISQFHSFQIRYGENDGYGDYFIKYIDEIGIYSLRMDSNYEVSLVLTTHLSQSVIKTFDYKISQFSINKDKLYYFDKLNRLVLMSVIDGVASEPEIVKHSESLIAYMPEVINESIYYYLGNGQRPSISSESKDLYIGNNLIVDFEGGSEGLSIISKVVNGYLVEIIKDGEQIFKSSLETSIVISNIALSKGEIFLSGPKGFYKLQGNKLVILSDVSVKEMIGTENCLLIEGDGRVHSYVAEELVLRPSAQNIFKSKDSCGYLSAINNEVIIESNSEVSSTSIFVKHQSAGRLYFIGGKLSYLRQQEHGLSLMSVADNSEVISSSKRMMGGHIVIMDERLLVKSEKPSFNTLIRLSF